jgi:hypothetical protein
MPRYHEPLVSVVFNRHYKFWNATVMAGFPAAEAEALVRDGIAHYPGEVPDLPLIDPANHGTLTSGREICARCGTYFEKGAQHECPSGATAATPEVFEAGFAEQGRSLRRGSKKRRGGGS